MESVFKIELLDKHKSYLKHYKPNDEYWGIGIEQEVYLEFSNPVTISRKEMLLQKQERYSVNYFKSYKPGVYQECLEKYLANPNVTKFQIPLLMNGHSFLKTDRKNQPKTLYRKNPPPNPMYEKSLFEFLQEEDRYFVEEYEKSFLFDGDTIEFPTQNFYKARVSDVVKELIETKEVFMNHLQKSFEKHEIYREHGTIQYASKNHPLAVFMTNYGHPTPFNNMTYHFNFTLPTKLDENGLIANPESFLERHRNAIRIFQWVSPLLIAVYGTPDPFHEVGPFGKGSQRCALSRYIGVGTFDTNLMDPGKKMTVDSGECKWYQEYHRDSGYEVLEKIGLDFNFHKHRNHGIEFRIFDWFPEEKLEDLLESLVHLLDHSLHHQTTNPVIFSPWNKFLLQVLKKGDEAVIDEEMLEELKDVFPGFRYRSVKAKEYFFELQKWLRTKYERGLCSRKMIGKVEREACCIIT